MSEMVEKVARAIYAAMPKTFEASGDFNRLWPNLQDSYRAVARAAIEAMREPTPTMMKEGNFSLDTGSSDDTWVAMINEALADRIRPDATP